MFDYDVVIIGAGPAGLTAALYLARGKRSVLVISEKIYDAQVGLLELIENYPGFSDGVSGAELIDAMVTQASNYGAEFTTDMVLSAETINGGFAVNCESGERLTSTVLIAASGSHHRKLGVPGEEELTGRGVFSCAFCDGGDFAGKPVAVIGGGDAGVTEALYLARLASHVYLLEMLPQLSAAGVLQDRLSETANITVRCGATVIGITGDSNVSGLTIENGTGGVETIDVIGVLVDIGLLPNTGYLTEVVKLEKDGRVPVDWKMSSDMPGLFAVGDVRVCSPGQISAAVGDGATAGIHAIKFLQVKEGI